MQFVKPIIFACLTLSVTACSLNESRYPDRNAIACGVALSYLHRQIVEFPNRRIVVSDEWYEPFPALSGGSNRFKTDDFKSAAPPSDELIARMQEQRNISVVRSCPTLQAYLKNARIEHGSRAVDKLIYGEVSEAVVIIAMSPAAVSDNGNEALIMTSVADGRPLVGSGFLEHFEKSQTGKWIAVARLGLWVS